MEFKKKDKKGIEKNVYEIMGKNMRFYGKRYTTNPINSMNLKWYKHKEIHRYTYTTVKLLKVQVHEKIFKAAN